MYDPIWVTRNGRRIRAGQMTDKHLYNCINKILRDGWRIHWLERLQLEVEIRRISRRS